MDQALEKGCPEPTGLGLLGDDDGRELLVISDNRDLGGLTSV